jgi:hypothetical protein
MFKQLQLAAINTVIVKVQSFLFSVYKEENTVMTLTVQQIDKTLRTMTTAEIKEIAKLDASEIVAKLG